MGKFHFYVHVRYIHFKYDNSYFDHVYNQYIEKFETKKNDSDDIKKARTRRN